MVFGRKHQEDVSPINNELEQQGTIPHVDPYTGRHSKVGAGIIGTISRHINTGGTAPQAQGGMSAGTDPNYNTATGGPVSNTYGTTAGNQQYDSGTTGTGTGMGTGMHRSHMQPTGALQSQVADPSTTQRGYYHDPNTGLRDPYPHTATGTAMGDSDVGAGTGYAPGAVGAGPGFADSGPGGHPNIPPTSSNTTTTAHGSGGTSFTGKIQSAAGSILHSSSLKAKGEEKQREAEALKMQGAEISEAERLEAEARQRRERAVASGAHPDHGYLGGIVPPRTDQNQTY